MSLYEVSDSTVFSAGDIISSPTTGERVRLTHWGVSMSDTRLEDCHGNVYALVADGERDGFQFGHSVLIAGPAFDARDVTLP